MQRNKKTKSRQERRQIRTKGKRKNSRFILAGGSILAALLVVSLWIRFSTEEKEQSLCEIVFHEEMQERIFTLTEEEAAFYEKKSPEGDGNAYAKEVYAVFEAGEKFGLCSPYSLSNLESEMEVENRNRQAKKNEGEVVYGKTSFKLEEFFDYRFSTVRSDTIRELTDAVLEKRIDISEENAKKYMEENKERFKTLEEITYTLNGKEEILPAQNMKIFEETNPELSAWLSGAKPGDTFQSAELGGTVEVTEIEYHEMSWEEDKLTIMEEYVTNEMYPELLREMESYFEIESLD
ncbi:hypothetical protein H8S37_03410 [Mediterraneibacter sp. NSJ-55]|uniref:Uncharacterized protein n=1 Tax=Mediterraneibacter hominis TaxID=2763054 RepID=A0A923LFX5_9FIRM|nr:hypothetical protein [Mediterraneibacter hominis]MBC5687982.1 hypothetical protein [Mediterraneibacter hominis]